MSETTRALGGRPEIHLGSGPDARVERSVTRARRMSRPAKAGATDEVRPAPPPPLWRCLSSTPKAGGFTAAAASADRAMRAGRVPRMPRWLSQPWHGSRAWYCPFALASGSDPRHGSRVALLAPESRYHRPRAGVVKDAQPPGRADGSAPRGSVRRRVRRCILGIR